MLKGCEIDADALHCKPCWIAVERRQCTSGWRPPTAHVVTNDSSGLVAGGLATVCGSFLPHEAAKQHTGNQTVKGGNQRKQCGRLARNNAPACTASQQMRQHGRSLAAQHACAYSTPVRDRAAAGLPFEPGGVERGAREREPWPGRPACHKRSTAGARSEGHPREALLLQEGRHLGHVPVKLGVERQQLPGAQRRLGAQRGQLVVAPALLQRRRGRGGRARA